VSESVDVLVLGAGMAGLAAAARAAQAGASVTLVEKAARSGGSAQYAGFIWTAPTLEVMHEINPDGDAALATRLVEGYPPAMDWVRSLGVEVKAPVTVLGYGRGCQTDMPQLLSACERVAREADDCETLFGARTERLLIKDGRVRGAEITTASGTRRRIRAGATVLATGGFGGDAELRAPTSTRSRATCPCARTQTASATGSASDYRRVPRSGASTPASTAISCRPGLPRRARTISGR
jgi:succinate dehydrogenase/fumarate reductase flavoprotein subunit